ncbi:L,D-transpeptidase [Labrys sp. LIt4]|uniref:L,D-transpeptidase n=1 Tax=Labrys okinawensis TaxID=346911 RepID=A0A2S9QEW0_9HYPH|nr:MULTISPECIES: L,D-transpeptidase [Labrys]MBP0578129.1 L,D-transpeptidase [Labrys sp. LIt4]PRH87893.1 L,D-transpeptidase [Labrys okinawensis]
MSSLSRRAFLVGASLAGLGFSLASCVTDSAAIKPVVVASADPATLPAVPVDGRPTDEITQPEQPLTPEGTYDYKAIYGQMTDGKFVVPAVDTKRIGPQFLRAEVDYPTSEPAGTIIVDPRAHYLYYVMGGGRAMRYGVGVGKQGFGWSGTAEIRYKREWPDWYPPKEMIARRPDLRPSLTQLQSGVGVRGGPRNPITGRAMYLWQNNKDTLYRIHGTNEPYSIGHNASSGCIRMIVQDAIDLYKRAPLGGRVVVLGPGMSEA